MNSKSVLYPNFRGWDDIVIARVLKKFLDNEMIWGRVETSMRTADLNQEIKL